MDLYVLPVILIFPYRNHPKGHCLFLTGRFSVLFSSERIHLWIRSLPDGSSKGKLENDWENKPFKGLEPLKGWLDWKPLKGFWIELTACPVAKRIGVSTHHQSG